MNLSPRSMRRGRLRTSRAGSLSPGPPLFLPAKTTRASASPVKWWTFNSAWFFIGLRPPDLAPAFAAPRRSRTQSTFIFFPLRAKAANPARAGEATTKPLSTSRWETGERLTAALWPALTLSASL